MAEEQEEITRGIDTKGFRSGIGGDIWMERQEGLESKLKHAKDIETPLHPEGNMTQYRNSGDRAIDILARTFRQEQPSFQPGERESTNVDDRRGETPEEAQARWNRERALYRAGRGPYLHWPDEIQQFTRTMPQRLVGGPNPLSPENAKKAYEGAIGMAQGFMEDVNLTLQSLLNPQNSITAEPGTEERFAQEMLAQRAQGRAAAGVALDLVGGGTAAAIGRGGTTLGTSGGRASRANVGAPARDIQGELPSIKIADDITLEWKPSNGGPDREFVVRREGHKKVGDGGVWRNPETGELEITTIDIRGIQKGDKREGIGPRIYDALDENVDKIVPSGSLSEEAMKMWQRRNPSAVLGKYWKEEIDDTVTWSRIPQDVLDRIAK